MSSIPAARQLVLSRLGAPAPLLPGERYRYQSSNCRRVYQLFDRYILEAIIHQRPDALPEFIAALEVERERDYEAFHFGRELLLDNLEITVEVPECDPEPGASAERPKLAMPKLLPRWSRRKPSRTKQPKTRLRDLVLEQLGRPHPRLPGESYVVTSSPALDEVDDLIDSLLHGPGPATTAALLDAVARVAQLRDEDWEAFYIGRAELLALLPVELEPPTPPAADFVLGSPACPQAPLDRGDALPSSAASRSC